MKDGTSPLYFAFGVIVIILFFIFAIKNNKKHIANEKGDEVDTHDYWGKPSTHNENYVGRYIIFGCNCYLSVTMFL